MSRIQFALSFLMLCAVVGCNKADRAWQRGYRSGYKSSYAGSVHESYPSQQTTGSIAGIQQAEADTKSGLTWRLYPNELAYGLLAGVIVGIATQYLILHYCHVHHRRPTWLAMALIPGVQNSMAYQMFTEKAENIALAETKLQAIHDEQEVQLRELESAYRLAKRSLLAAKNIDEIHSHQGLALAKRAFANIILRADKKARQLKMAKLRNLHVCPACERTIRYHDKIADTKTQCPNPDCGYDIQLPPLPTTPTTSIHA